MQKRPTSGPATARRRRQLTRAIKASLRELSNQLSLLNHHISAHIDLNDTDLDCLELINRHGSLNPSALARRAGLHPATITGILDRLERGGWVARERDPSDRRAVVVRALRDRNAELFRLYAGMNTAMDQLCASYGDDELQLLADFLHRPPTPDEPPPTSWPATEQQPRPAPHRGAATPQGETPSSRSASHGPTYAFDALVGLSDHLGQGRAGHVAELDRL